MSEMRELYQQVIIDHGRHPRNFGTLEKANHVKVGFNPLCGDKLTVYVLENNGVIDDLRFEGCGCAISMASASLMTQQVKGKLITEAAGLFDDFHRVVTGHLESSDKLGKLMVLAGVAEYPSRVKCATLCWHTLKAALDDSHGMVSTE